MNSLRNISVSKIMSFKRFCWTPNCLLRTFIALGVILLIAASAVWYTPTRNAFIGHILPAVWRDVDTEKLLKIHRLAQPIDVGECPKTCHSLYKPKARLEDIEKRGVKFYNDIKYDPRFYKNNIWKFLPLMSKPEKKELLHIFDVMDEVLKIHNLQYFMVDGTLLGVIRHHGIIPWDDDIDVALNGSEWQKVKDALCCVEGFSLVPRNFMHWKFFKDTNARVRNSPEFTFPFVDMFFYMEDDEYIWSITHYNIQNLVARKEEMFPLTTAELDGKLYSVPKDYERFARRQYPSMSVCVSPGMFHKYNHALRGKEKAAVLCHSLSDLYTMYTS